MKSTLPLIREKIADGIYIPTALDAAATWCRWFILAEIEREFEFISQSVAESTSIAERGTEQGKWLRETVFPQKMRYSQLVMLYSKLEGGMKTIAEIYAPVVGTLPKPTYIRNLQKFFEGIPGFSFPADHTWEEILNLGGLRNAIIHDEGFVQGARTPAAVRAYISSRLPDLQINEIGQVEISDSYVRDSAEAIKRFFLNLADSCLVFAEQSVVNAGD